MTKLYVEADAELELEQAAVRYEESVGGLGVQFLAEMRGRVRDVVAAPLSFPIFGDVVDVRCAHATGRFPHLVVYMLVDDTVHVLAFMHPRQRPGYWTARARRLP
jgi:hypothetical protein